MARGMPGATAGADAYARSGSRSAGNFASISCGGVAVEGSGRVSQGR
jgi:hypothetical protein